MKKMVIVVLFSIVVCLQFVSCNSNDQPTRNKNTQEGFQLAQKYCSSCHLLPEPASPNKLTWAEHVLPKMSGMLGFRRFASDYIHVSEKPPVITLDQWKNIVRYYVSEAPEDPVETGDFSSDRYEVASFSS